MAWAAHNGFNGDGRLLIQLIVLFIAAFGFIDRVFYGVLVQLAEHFLAEIHFK
jgi:hypothetical protein